LQPKEFRSITGISGWELTDPNAIEMDRPNPFRLVYAAGANTVSTLFALVRPALPDREKDNCIPLEPC
jgi:hypothetical protein